MNIQIISRKEAISQGLKRYFTGEPCKHGHVAERNTKNTRCCSCISHDYKKYFSKNKDNILEWNKEYRKKYDIKNKDKIKAYGSEYRKINKQKLKDVAKEYYSLNKEKTNKRNNENYLKRRDVILEKQKQYRLNNKDKILSKQRNRRSRIAGNIGKHTEKEIIELLKKQNYRCANCLHCIKERKNRHLDHIMPISLGGRNDIVNLQWLCVKCNLNKGAKDPIKFAQENGKLF